MAETYEGLYVKFGADTVEFDNSVKGINKATSLLKKDINTLNKNIKLDPSSVENYNKKLENFQEQLELGAKKVSELRKEQEALGSDKIGTAEWQKLESEIAKTESQMNIVRNSIERTKDTIASITPASIKNLNGEIENVNSRLAQLDRELALDDSNVAAAAEKMELLAKKADLADQKVSELKAEQSKLGNDDLGTKKWNNLEKDIQEAELQAKEFKSEISKVNNEKLNNLIQSVDGVKDKISEVGDTLTDKVTKPILAVGTAGTVMANEIGSSQSLIQASMGMSEKSAASLNESVKNIYGKGFTDSVDTAREALTTVLQNIPSLADESDEALESITSEMLALSKATDSDFNESIRGVNSLMTAFGMTAEEAMDYLAKGTQQGLNKTDELGDNLAEYAPLFEQNGYSAQEMFQILQDGLDGGAYNLDKVNDLVKEFGIRVSDGTIKGAVDEMDQQWKDIYNTWEKAGGTNKELFSEMSKGLSKIKDPQEKQNALTQIWGSLGEDAGYQVVQAMAGATDEASKTNGAFSDVNGTAKELAGNVEKSQKWQSAFNRLKIAAAEFGEALAPVVDKLADFVTDMAGKFEGMSDKSKTSIGILVVALGSIGPALKLVTGPLSLVSKSLALFTEGGLLAGVGGAFSGLGGTIAALAWPITLIVGAIVAVGLALKQLWDNSEEFRNNITNAWNSIKDSLGMNSDTIKGSFESIGTKLKEVWDTYLKPIWDFIVEIIGVIAVVIVQTVAIIAGTLNGLAQIISGFFSGNDEQVKSGMEKIKTTWSTAWNAIKDYVSSIDWLGLGMSVLKAIGDGILALGSFLWGVVKNIFKTAWDLIKGIDWIGLGIDVISSIVGGLINMALSVPTQLMNIMAEAIRWAKNMDWAELGRSIIDFIVTGLANLGSKMWNSMTDAIKDAKDKFKNTDWGDVGKSIINGIVESLSGLGDAIGKKISGAISDAKAAAGNLWNAITGGGKSFSLNANYGAFSTPNGYAMAGSPVNNSTSLTVNVTANGGNEKSIADAVERTIIRNMALRRR